MEQQNSCILFNNSITWRVHYSTVHHSTVQYDATVQYSRLHFRAAFPCSLLTAAILPVPEHKAKGCFKLVSASSAPPSLPIPSFPAEPLSALF